MKFIKTYETFSVNESFSSLSEEQKIALNAALLSIKDSSMDKSNINSDAANLKGEQRKPFYDRGESPLEGLGKPYAEFVSGSVNKEKDIITAEVVHGVSYSTNKKTEFKSLITMDAKTLEYTTKKIHTQL